MKVVKVPGLKKFTNKCTRCLCEFEYELSDTYRLLTSEYVTCPECEQELMHSPTTDQKVLK